MESYCLLSLAPFTQHNPSENTPSLGIYQQFTAFYCQVAFSCMDVPQSAYLFTSSRAFESSLSGGIMNNVTINIYAQRFCVNVLSFLLGKHPGTAESHGKCMSDFTKNCPTSFQKQPFCTPKHKYWMLCILNSFWYLKLNLNTSL